MKVLAIGAQAQKVAKQFYPEADIEQVDVQPHNFQMKADYDAVFCYHALPRVSHKEAGKALRMWSACLKAGGEFQLFVPSLEWAARQILSPTPSRMVEEHLFGRQGDSGEYYTSGYTLRDLRTLCEKVGINIEHARVGEYTLGDEVCEMHLLLGRKA